MPGKGRPGGTTAPCPAARTGVFSFAGGTGSVIKEAEGTGVFSFAGGADSVIKEAEGTGVFCFAGGGGSVINDAGGSGSGRAANGTYWSTPSPTISNRFPTSLDATGPSSIWLRVAAV